MHILADSSLETEIWSIYRGLTIILGKEKNNVQLESDSSVAVNLINEGAPGNHPQSTSINDAKILLNRMGTTLSHI